MTSRSSTKIPMTTLSHRLLLLLHKEKDPVLALRMFKNPRGEGSPKLFRYSISHYVIIIQKLGWARMIDEMEEVLHELKSTSRLLPRENLFCAVINLYSRVRKPERAIKLFHEIPEYRCERTIKSFNSLLKALVVCREHDRMKQILMEADRFVRADSCTYNILIHELCRKGRFTDAMKMFEEMNKKGIRPDCRTFSSLIHWLCLHSRLEESLKLKELLNVFHLQPDAHIYSSLMNGFLRSGKLETAFELKEEMKNNNVQMDSVIYNTLMYGLLKAGRSKQIDELLNEMKLNDHKPDTSTYNIIILRHCQDGKFKTAINLLHKMAKEGCKPDVVSFNTIFSLLCKDGK